MRPLRRAPLRCDITLLTPFFFFVYIRDILQENWTKEREKRRNINASTATVTTAAVFLVQLLVHVQEHFFHSSILSTDLILVGEWQLLRDYKLKKKGGGVCRTFASRHFLHFFMDCFIVFCFLHCGYEEILDGEGRQHGTGGRVRTSRDVKKKTAAAEDLWRQRDHAETLWALIVLHDFY